MCWFEEKVNLLQNVRGGITDIIDELKRMRAFFRAADATYEIDFEHTVWAQEVRYVTYESEDVLDGVMCSLASQLDEGSCAQPNNILSNIMNLGARVDIASTVQAITQNFDNGSEHGLATITGAASQRWPDRLADAFFLEKTDLVGIEGPKKNKVMDMLTSKDQTLNVVSVGGHGRIREDNACKAGLR